ncbi:hypothetical protein [Megamonas hypermegale]|uniref:hypothetical protein n=1 Tax=Megamonas hypermegale TaxID=158847 RepID=UPI0026ECB062|nr:hypothetical protein [Megamonas hypermegale]
MVSRLIFDSEPFLKLPLSTQALYVHLILNADDDGVVEAGKVLKFTSASEMDLEILVQKQYLIILSKEYMIAFITHWFAHNTIRADRKKDSYYKDLLLQVLPDVKLVEKKQRSDRLPKLEYVEEASDTVTDETEVTSDKQSISVIVEQLFEKYNMTKSLKLFRKAFDDELIYRQLQNLMIELKKKTIKIKDITAWLYSACYRDYPLKQPIADDKPVSSKKRYDDSEVKKRAERQLKALKDELD